MAEISPHEGQEPERIEPTRRHDKRENSGSDTADVELDRILAGIPAYNEEVSIGSTVLEAKKYATEVIVVDDGSDDKTVEVAREAGAVVLCHEENMGKGAAMQSLFEHAVRYEWDAIVLLDGDGQHIPDDIPTVVEPVLEVDADMVIGSRYLDRESDDETPRYRRFGQKVLDLLTFGTSGVNVTDSQSGFRALSPQAVSKLTLTTDGFGVESEMLQSASSADLSVTERPIDVRYQDVDGQTANPITHGISVINSILHLVRDRRPLLFFGLPGILIATIGVVYGIQGILIYQNTNVFYPAKAMVSGFLVIIGVLSGFCGLMLNQITQIIAQTSD